MPYVVFRDGVYTKVKRRNISTGWDQVGDNIGANVIYSKILVDNTNKLLVDIENTCHGSFIKK